MKLRKKTLFECSISIPLLRSDKEGMLVGGFSGISVATQGADSPVNYACQNYYCANGMCMNRCCTNGGCDNASCTNSDCVSVSVKPTGTPLTTTGSSAGTGYMNITLDF